MADSARPTPVIVGTLRIIGAIEIIAGGVYLLVSFAEAFGSNEPGPGSSAAFSGIGVIVSGLLFLAVAFIADKLDAIDHHLTKASADGESTPTVVVKL